MANKYAECHRAIDGKVDGCQEFMSEGGSFNCKVCFCHRNYHRKVVPPEVVYTKCHKIHNFGSHVSVDGCQEFTPKGKIGMAEVLTCALCGCHKGFHRNEVATK